MMLIVDIGNSAIKAGVFDGSNLLRTWRLPSITSDAARIADILQDYPAIASVAIGSGVPELTQIVSDLFRGIGLDVVVLNASSKLPISISYQPPESVGIDRLANVVGAKLLYGAPAIVVDVGTAVTVDVLNADNIFVGGAIWAGPHTVSRALGANAAALHEVEISTPTNAIGRSTVECLQSGIMHGLLGGAERLIRHTRAELGTNAPVIVTGGGADYLHELKTLVTAFEPALTLHGLRAIYESLQINKSK